MVSIFKRGDRYILEGWSDEDKVMWAQMELSRSDLHNLMDDLYALGIKPVPPPNTKDTDGTDIKC